MRDMRDMRDMIERHERHEGSVGSCGNVCDISKNRECMHVSNVSPYNHHNREIKLLLQKFCP
jgi:hypothetical protein